MRRAAAGLQRLRRQRRDGARTAARDARRGVRRPRGQRRQRHRVGPRARRTAGRPGRLPGPRLVGDAARRADHLGLDDRRRRSRSTRTAGASTTRRTATPKPRSQVLAQPGGVAWNVFDARLLALARGFPDFVERRSRRRGARRSATPRALARLIGCDAATLADTLAGTRLDAALPRDPRHRRVVPHPGRARHRRAGARAARTTARRCPTCSPPAARHAACRATRSGATCRATGCSARWPAASSPRAPPPHSSRGACMTPSLKQRLHEPRVLLAPGVYDALSALIAEQAGFEALYLSGASIAYTRLGRSDVGLTTSSEVEDTLARITERVAAAGDRRRRHRLRQCAERAAHGARVRARRRGDDPARGPDLPQALRPPRRQGAWCRPPRCAASCAPRSMRAARRDTLILARTDALAVEGLEAALERAEAYLACGVDALFVEALARPGSRWTRPARASPRACRCWPTWSKAARRRCRVPANWGSAAFGS